MTRSATTPPTLLAGEGLTKAYGASRAIDAVDISITTGSIHGLLGKNGAGKTTLASVISGLTRHDSGRLHFDGQNITVDSPAHRRRRGIRLLGQHSEVVDALTVTENLLLGDLPRTAARVDWKKAHATAERVLADHHLNVSPKARVADLSLSERRRIEIVKVLVGDGRLVILDEPTTGLSLRERRDLIDWIHDLAAKGMSFIYISHHNDEVRQLCTEYTVLRDGKVVETGRDVAGLTSARLSALVNGSEVDQFNRSAVRSGPEILDVTGLRIGSLGPFDLRVRAGEIVGLVGLPGSGAQAVMRGLAGLSGTAAGQVRVGGAIADTSSPRRSLRSGIAYLTDDRMSEGVVPEMSIADNVHLGRWPTRRPPVIDWSRTLLETFRIQREFTIRMGGPKDEVRTLSGGNQQKVLLGRILSRQPRVLLLDEPTVGVDVAAKEEIHRLIDAASRRGTAVIVRAYDPEETVRLVDRAVLFADGQITGELAGDALTIDAVATAQHVGGRSG